MMTLSKASAKAGETEQRLALVAWEEAGDLFTERRAAAVPVETPTVTDAYGHRCADRVRCGDHVRW